MKVMSRGNPRGRRWENQEGADGGAEGLSSRKAGCDARPSFMQFSWWE